MTATTMRTVRSKDGAKALVENLPNARHEGLAGQDHAVDPTTMAPMLRDFFRG
jgi:hypothetical protein